MVGRGVLRAVGIFPQHLFGLVRSEQPASPGTFPSARELVVCSRTTTYRATPWATGVA